MTIAPHFPKTAIYGSPSPELVDLPDNAAQVSPLVPGALALEELPPAALEQVLALAPPGTIERRHMIAHALRALAPDAPLTVLAPKDKGGTRLRKELEAFGCTVGETARRHFRICECARPAEVTGIDEAIADGKPRFVEALGLVSQPGVFSWDRIDPGSARLLDHLPAFSGCGADFGCGIGFLSRAVLASPKVQELALIDIDRRAIDCAKENIKDERASFHWTDLRKGAPVGELDFVVMNPPFHDAGEEDRGLGQALVRTAAGALRRGGALWFVANRHLPYEAVIQPLFRRVSLKVETGGYKVYEAVK